MTTAPRPRPRHPHAPRRRGAAPAAGGAAASRARRGRERAATPRGHTDLRGRVAMVTGAGRGSAAVAAALAESGASVVIGAPDELAIARVARSVEGRGGRALALGTDLGDPDGVARLTDEALAVFGRLDVAVNAPGRTRGLDDLAEPDCRGVYFAVRHQLPAIAASGGGSIVNVALGPLGWSDDARCVAGLTRASALEHAGSGVRINALARGPGSRGFVEAACWLCSDAASELNGALVSDPAGADARDVVPAGPPGAAA
jgi:NAD(P)-dependent dehydrogenase (short-subunit alcohol dehydrogenase family)